MASPFDHLGTTDLPVEDLPCDRPAVLVHIDDESAGYREWVESPKNATGAWQSLREAVHRGDDFAVRAESLHLRGPLTHPAKKEAIAVDRRDDLELLSKRDNSIDDLTVAAACERKDRDSIRLLHDFGWPIDAPIRLTASLLCETVDDVDLTRCLIEAGADVGARNGVGESALSMAIAHRTMEVVEILLAHGTDTMHGDLLYHAARRDDEHEGAQVVEELVRRGAAVDTHQYNNALAYRWKGLSTLRTPLYLACARGNLPVARALLQHGADPRRRVLNAGPTPPTPLDKALAMGDKSLIDLLRAREPDRALL